MRVIFLLLLQIVCNKHLRILGRSLSIRLPLLKAGVSAFALTLFLFVHLLSWSSDLHHDIHHDAHEEQHECAVTLLQSGQIDLPIYHVTVSFAAELITFETIQETFAVVVRPSICWFSRGPPSLA